MLNPPHNPFAMRFGPDAPGEGSWRTDQNPGLRLGILFASIAVPLLAVFARIVWLQTSARPRFMAQFERTYEEIESIPAPDGRILGSDGRVLAYDEERFRLEAHYRWLEAPPDADWLRKQAYAQLAPRDRRDTFLVEAAEADVLRRRDEMWRRVAELTGHSRDELASTRREVQHRVERISRLVNERQKEKRRKQLDAAREAPRADTFAERLWLRIRKSVTTPPVREGLQPIVVREELDYHPVLDNIPFEVVAEIESHPELYPGLHVSYATRRIYPQGPLASHVVGHRGSISQEEAAARTDQFASDPLDYHFQDRKGITGIERSYDRHLRGFRGQRRIIRNRMGEIVKTEIVREPRAGQDLVLTLDLALQQRAEALLDRVLADSPEPSHKEDDSDEAEVSTETPTGGCIVVLDVRTGEVIACANGPRHDLSLLNDFDPAAWQELLNDARRPFFPRATQMAIAPGSIFKTVTAAALLQSGRVDPDEPFFCQGYLHKPNRYRCYIYRHYGVGHGDVTLREALAQSCNVYFFNAGLQIGGDEIARWAAKFGFGSPTGIDLPGEAAGQLPLPRRSSDGRHHWAQSETLGMAIGQSRLTVTPLQIASLMATIANGGERITPYLAQSSGQVRTGNSGTFVPPSARRIPGLRADTLQRIHEGLDRVVNWHRGTGYKTVRLPQVRIAGKTGTAEVGPTQPDHAWFAGYVPADAPRYAFAVVLEHGGGGGKSAGPVARGLVEAMLEIGLIEVPSAPAAN